MIRNLRRGRGVPTAVSVSVAAGQSAVLLSVRDADVRSALEGVHDARVRSCRLGDGRTATFISPGEPDDAWPAFAYWPRDEHKRWAWACRSCGTVDDRYRWEDVDEGAPMDRAEPWRCPTRGCPGAPRWHRLS